MDSLFRKIRLGDHLEDQTAASSTIMFDMKGELQWR
jgi:hypothetical protein